MGKRSDFTRIERDFYPTPPSAVLPLLPFLKTCTRYAEPCAGDGALIRMLKTAGHHHASAYDIEPAHPIVERHDARTRLVGNIDCFITNPPWSRPLLHELIVHLSDQHPTWLLFDADWPHTRQAVPFLPRLRKIVAVGRVKWIPDSPFVGKDNCCWYLFDRPCGSPTEFYGRGK
jgi:hypothetical protein